MRVGVDWVTVLRASYKSDPADRLNALFDSQLAANTDAKKCVARARNW